MADEPAAPAADRAPGGVDFTSTADGVLVSFWGVVDSSVRDGGTADLWTPRDPGRELTVDCRRVTRIDSIGLSILVRLVRDAVHDGEDVRFAGGDGPVWELLETTGVEAWMRNLGVAFDA